MSTSFSPISFKAQAAAVRPFPTADNQELRQKNEAIQAKSLESKVIEPKKEKVGLVQGFKDFLAGFQKGWIKLKEYTKGTVTGAINGAISGAAVYGAFMLRDYYKNMGKQASEKLFKTPGFVKAPIAAIAFISTLCVSLFKSSLNVSEKSSKVDHRYNSGHMRK